MIQIKQAPQNIALSFFGNRESSTLLCLMKIVLKIYFSPSIGFTYCLI